MTVAVTSTLQHDLADLLDVLQAGGQLAQQNAAGVFPPAIGCGRGEQDRAVR
ncbi:MAG TPA: hypothetical protein VJT49_05975 [Amycolatopsis sp.]|uniref:hypothetical protein n=1 Tax=Amycolatopsis sp. TaxID=37632 RepID=UPI002B468B34|nr:hypothetical protein [Amycolatopsis sp.]HKS44654.1 hypothetical protein [Amycolatopsis sp.]